MRRRLLHDKPNPLTPAHRFWSTAVAHYLLWGNIFIEKVRGDSALVEELWLLDPAEITVEWDANSRSRRFYRDIPGQGRKYWSEDEVLHIGGHIPERLRVTEEEAPDRVPHT